MRVTKGPEVRQKELIAAAEELFREKGCEETSVSDIVRKVGVAQGTFYYYFESKDDILDAVLDHYLQGHMVPAVQGILADTTLNPRQKLQRVIDRPSGSRRTSRRSSSSCTRTITGSRIRNTWSRCGTPSCRS